MLLASDEVPHRFGQGPIDIKDGDIVCIILGRDLRMVVRMDPESGLDEILGPCYWQCAIFGEVITALEKSEAKLKTSNFVNSFETSTTLDASISYQHKIKRGRGSIGLDSVADQNGGPTSPRHKRKPLLERG